MVEEEPSGFPGIPPRWTSSAKEGVGTAMERSSKIHFTISHGILNEVYYPGLDTAQIRDQELLIVGNQKFFEEKRDTIHNIETIRSGIPSYIIHNEEKDGSFKIEKTIFVDGENDVLVQHVIFRNKSNMNLDLYTLISPHINNGGSQNTSWIGEYKGKKFQFASKDGTYLALYSDQCQGEMSCGYSGYSDGWQDLKHNFKLTTHFESAKNGNTAITGKVTPENNGSFDIFIAFGSSPEEAALKTIRSKNLGWENALKNYNQKWNAYRITVSKNKLLSNKTKKRSLEDLSLLVLRSHISKEPLAGGLIASLSIPWGFSKGDDDLGGYHLIWARDMVEAAQGLILMGDIKGAVEALRFLQSTQEEDGHWPQNMWLNGTPYWKGLQMDETAFPLILLHDLWKRGHIDLVDFKEMLLRAVNFILANGPVTDQDRWEEDGGYSAFTITVEITALNKASEMADNLGLKMISDFSQELADIYLTNMDKWLYRTNTELSRKYAVQGHYVRISQSDQDEDGFIPIKNRPWSANMMNVQEVVSTGSLSMVRFGLKSPNDQNILNTIKIIDGELLVETPNGPVWHRYTNDGYGEHNEGSPFDGTGHGRGWPLLTGERANYEISAGNLQKAEYLLKSMENFANLGGMIPEQVWDSEDIAERGLFKGKPSGSAMPLVWAHAEYLKTCWGIENGRPYDQDQNILERYVNKKLNSGKDLWSFRNKTKRSHGKEAIIIVARTDFFLRFTKNNWMTYEDTNSQKVLQEVHYVEVDTKEMKEGDKLEFTFYWKISSNWEAENFHILF